MLRKSFSKILFLILMAMSVFPVAAQRQDRKKNARETTPAQEAETKAATDGAEDSDSAKKNSRPADEETKNLESEPIKKNSKTKNSTSLASAEQTKSIYFYEFSRPGFSVEKIHIEHDGNGKGVINFEKKYYDGEISDPIALSLENAEKIKTLWQNLNFLDSTENYQYEKDYSHLGDMKFTMEKDGRTRTAEFNWTTNADAKALADEYRKVSNQYIWMFDINVARENQPLESTKLMDALDSQIRRDEIADPAQMIPFLKELSNDERIPLISRNHAARIVKDIEKKSGKKKENN